MKIQLDPPLQYYNYLTTNYDGIFFVVRKVLKCFNLKDDEAYKIKNVQLIGTIKENKELSESGKIVVNATFLEINR
jgi:hypothetical protein